MWYTLIGGFLETLLIILAGLRLIGVSIHKRWTSIIIISFYGSTILMMVRATIPSMMYLLITILAIGLLMTFIIEIGVAANIVALLLGCLTLLCAEVISYALLKKLSLIDFSISSELPLITAFPHLIVMILILLILSKIKFYIPIQLKKIKSTNYKVFSLLFILFGFLFLFYSYTFEATQIELLSFSSALFLITLTISVFFIIRKQLASTNESLEDSLNNQYEEDISKQIKIIRSQRHDFIHHLLATKQMLNSGKYKESSAYINDVLNESSYASDVLPVASDALSGLLLSYKEKAKSNQIELFYHITDNLMSFPCKVYESNKIFGNLLANAIDAVRDLPLDKKYIHMKVSKDSYYRIEISNFIDENSIERDASKFLYEGFSTKKDHNGLGLIIVEEIAEKYNGTIHFDIKNDLITFYIKLPCGGYT